MHTSFKKNLLTLGTGCLFGLLFLTLTNPAQAVVQRNNVVASADSNAFAKSKPAGTTGVSVRNKVNQIGEKRQSGQPQPWIENIQTTTTVQTTQKVVNSDGTSTQTAVETEQTTLETEQQAALNALKEKVDADKTGNTTDTTTESSETTSELVQKLTYGEQIQDWTVKQGDTLQSLLMQWSEESGWTLVWKLDRDYVLEAGVVFRGTYMDVSMALLRSFARANPAPIGTFYKGNRVLVVSTREDENEG